MSALHILLPPLPAFAGERSFLRWLARGNRLPNVARPRDNVLRALFRFSGSATPAAALRHHAHADDAGIGSWLAADPAYVRSEATGARLMAWPVLDLTQAEAEQLAATLRPLFGDAGKPLTVDTPSTWCLHLPAGAPLAEFVAPVDALGADLLECLPGGDAARPWRHLFNEAQVALHAHPVNAARIEAGKLPVNALWFWGGGVLPAAVATALVHAASSDDVVRGLAKLANVRCESSSPSPDGFGERGDVLLDLDGCEPSALAGEWLPFFQRDLRNRRFDAIALTFASGDAFRVRHVHRLRIWRRG